MNKAISHLSIININDEKGTPKDLYAKACIEYDIFPEIDICASVNNHVCSNYITKELNCLIQNQFQPFYMNPPYSEIYKFMKYAYEQHIKNNLDALILTYSKTETKFWHEFVEGKAEVHFIKGRLNFNDDSGKPQLMLNKKTNKLIKGTSPYPSCWIIYRAKK